MLLPLYYQVPVFHVTLIPKILVKKGLYLPANSGVSNFRDFTLLDFPLYTEYPRFLKMSGLYKLSWVSLAGLSREFMPATYMSALRSNTVGHWVKNEIFGLMGHQI